MQKKQEKEQNKQALKDYLDDKKHKEAVREAEER